MEPYPEAARAYRDFRSWIWSCGLRCESTGVVDGGLDRGLDGMVPGMVSRSVSRRVAEPRRPQESEMEIQARWFGGEFGRTFTGIDGESIEIVQFGHWNHAAGPDFTECAVRIDGELKSGAIELDLDARDWESHGHGSNPEFEEVVLHVFTDGPSWNRVFTRTKEHRNVAQLQLPQYAWAQGPPDFLPEAFPGRCLAPLSGMTDAEVSSLLLSASQYRLQQKTARLDVMSRSTSTEQALFQGLAEALGFRTNKTAMAILAQRCPIAQLRDLDPIEREARLFGAAGFLDQRYFEKIASEESRPYLRGLWDQWWRIRDQLEPTPRRAIRWNYSGNRPLNHPHRRVGALAALVSQWPNLSPLWEQPVNRLEKHVNNFVKNLDHRFWNHHYTLKAPASVRHLRLIGQDRLRDLLGNVVFPGAIRENESLWDEFRALRKVDSNQKLRRASLRLFGPDRERRKLFTSYYHQQQGLLQIYHDFCLEDLSECEHCPFPEQIVQWQTKEEPAAISL